MPRFPSIAEALRRRAFTLNAAALLAVALLLPPGVAGTASAQSYPSRTVKIVLSYPTGGSVDFLARKISEQLEPRLGQPVIVEGRPGANERIASNYLLNQPADGHTILLVAVPHATNPSLFAKMSYDTRKDFAPLILAADVSQLVVVRAESELKTFADVVRLAKAKPRQITYGTPGLATGNHLMMELLTQAAGIELLHVPYKGLAPLTPAILGGHTEIGVFSVSPPLLSLVENGRMRALGIPTEKRSAISPDTPTFAEQGYPGVIGGTWFGLVMRAGTPPDIVDRLNKEINSILAMPDVRESLEKAGMTPRGGTPEQFRQHIGDEIEKWRKVIKASNIVIE